MLNFVKEITRLTRLKKQVILPFKADTNRNFSEFMFKNRKLSVKNIFNHLEVTIKNKNWSIF